MFEHKNVIKKKPSGAQFRKRKAEKQKEFQNSKKLMNIDKYIKPTSQIHNDVSQPCEEDASISDFEQVQDNSTADNDIQGTSNEVNPNLMDVSNSATWPFIRNRNIIDHIISTGPVQIYLNEYLLKNPCK